jgi:hypothetical protein
MEQSISLIRAMKAHHLLLVAIHQQIQVFQLLRAQIRWMPTA